MNTLDKINTAAGLKDRIPLGFALAGRKMWVMHNPRGEEEPKPDSGITCAPASSEPAKVAPSPQGLG